MVINFSLQLQIFEDTERKTIVFTGDYHFGKQKVQMRRVNRHFCIATAKYLQLTES